ncbi:Lrp/AsnC family leucine-responsive transcriptional regulator [Gillisia sp. Hel_I_86]|uniref:Lrp/AsnC family transcriptional regulator n=1 Tax=Gillisia sp. Hel_I_86 TaxID=1249981 RepID=UPI00119B77B7|nr:Lrp/AsnC family transcriptional regulator [Gillisia sp. Hel_I_86]TVZ28440.1 Lrp/AsnC family leucine-responsive transcriptional regulator [Gillisia sp. Hel_I_86]
MLDIIDQKIIAVLQLNSRASFVEIGKQIPLSASSVRERIQKLEELEIIMGYSLKLDHAKMGYGLQVFIMIKLFSGKLKSFMEAIDSFPEIKRASRITGSHNIHMKVVLKDQLHLQQFIDKLINYGEPTTHLILSELK